MFFMASGLINLDKERTSVNPFVIVSETYLIFSGVEFCNCIFANVSSCPILS